MARLRQAKEEADREVQQYRTNMEADYQNKLSEVPTINIIRTFFSMKNIVRTLFLSKKIYK